MVVAVTLVPNELEVAVDEVVVEEEHSCKTAVMGTMAHWPLG